MIFATTGTQLPFPRLMAALDALAPTLAEPIVAQTGPDPARYAHLEVHTTLTPEAFGTHFTRARVVLGHVGIGTILSAQRLGKPAILVPRRHALGEHRNDHQLATATALDGTQGLYIAWQTEDIAALLTQSDLAPMGEAVSDDLTALRRDIATWIARV